MPYSDEQLIQLIQKAGITTATGGQVPPEAVSDFINLMTDQTSVLQHMRIERDIIKSRTIDGLEFGDPVMQEAPAEGSEPNENAISEPEMPRLTLTPTKAMIAVNISFDWLRKNIAGENAGEQAVNAALAKAYGRDLVRLIFNGDTALDSSTKLNRLLKLRDGLLKKARADANVNDVVVAANPVYSGSGSEFSKTLTAIPDEYRDDRSMLRHFVAMDVLDQFEDEVSERQTSAGDGVLIGNADISMHKKVKIVPVFGMPSDTPLTTNYSNVVVGFGRDMKMWREIKPRKQQVELTIITDVDFGYVFGEVIALGEKA
ncbi:MAG: hypothetical protein ABJ387_03525 [Balneola sp.]